MGTPVRNTLQTCETSWGTHWEPEEHHWEHDENTRSTKFHPNTSRFCVVKQKYWKLFQMILYPPSQLFFGVKNFNTFTDESWYHDPWFMITIHDWSGRCQNFESGRCENFESKDWKQKQCKLQLILHVRN